MSNYNDKAPDYYSWCWACFCAGLRTARRGDSEFVNAISDELKQAWESCESPIEEIFLTAFYIVCSGDIARPKIWDPSLPFPKPDAPIIITPQYEIENYRVDFAIFADELKIAVECDGHNFHERTKEQAQRDRLKDRVLQSLGWIVFRFTGSELTRDAFKCACEIKKFIAANKSKISEPENAAV